MRWYITALSVLAIRTPCRPWFRHISLSGGRRRQLKRSPQSPYYYLLISSGGDDSGEREARAIFPFHSLNGDPGVSPRKIFEITDARMCVLIVLKHQNYFLNV